MIYLVALLPLVIGIWLAARVANERIPPPSNVCDEDIAALVRSGKELQAIKWYRSLHRSSLRDAKDAIYLMRTR